MGIEEYYCVWVLRIPIRYIEVTRDPKLSVYLLRIGGVGVPSTLQVDYVTDIPDTESKPRTSTGRGYDYYKPI